MEKKLPQSFLDALNNIASPDNPPDAKGVPPSMPNLDPSMTFEKTIDRQGKRNKYALNLITLLLSEDFREFPLTLQTKVTELLFETIQKNTLMAIMDLACATDNLEKSVGEKPLSFKEHLCFTFAMQLVMFKDHSKLVDEIIQAIDEHQKAHRRDP